MTKKKRSILDMLEQIDADPRFQATMQSLHGGGGIPVVDPVPTKAAEPSPASDPAPVAAAPAVEEKKPAPQIEVEGSAAVVVDSAPVVEPEVEPLVPSLEEQPTDPPPPKLRLARKLKQGPVVKGEDEEETLAGTLTTELAPELVGDLAPDLSGKLSGELSTGLSGDLPSNIAPDLAADLSAYLANEPTGTLASELATVLAVEPVTSPVSYPVNEPVNYPVKQETKVADRVPAKVVVSGQAEPVSYPVGSPVNYPLNDKWAPLSEKQGKVLLYLIQAGGVANRLRISDVTGVGLATVKYTLRVLTKAGYIGNVNLFIQHKNRGLTYTLDHQLCSDYVARVQNFENGGNSDPVNYPVSWPVSYPVKVPANPAVSVVALAGDLSSSRSKNESLSSKDFEACGKLETALSDDPELDWWRDQGLTVQQIEAWMEAGKCTEDQILQSLRHFAWDVVENNKASELTKEPENYFFTVIRRGGYYRAPKGYKSWAERKAEIEQELLAQKQAEIKRLADLRKRHEEADLELELQQILSDPAGEAYKALEKGLSTFEHGSSRKIREIALRREFRKSRGLEAEEG